MSWRGKGWHRRRGARRADAAGHPRGHLPSLPVQAVQLFGLWGFAFAYPLFGILGSSPSFFIAHGAYGSQIIAFTAAVLLLPPLVLLSVLRIVQVASATAARWAMAVVFGGFVALTVVPAIDRAGPLRVRYFVLALAVIACAAALSYVYLTPIRLFATYLGPAPLLFAGFFLLMSPSSALVVSDEPTITGAPVAASATDVFVLVFDELPLGGLLDTDGELDESRYPGFARLARSSTWYRNATTVSPATVMAVPSMLTGLRPAEQLGRTWPPTESDVPPVANRYPRSLFRMLAETHAIQAHEWVTRLCSRDICEAPVQAAPDLATDVRIISTHLLLPQRAAAEHLPPLDDQWAGFGQAESPEQRDENSLDEAGAMHAELGQQNLTTGDQLEAALPTIRASSSPQLWFAHDRRPHRPHEYLPDGARYESRLAVQWGIPGEEPAGMVLHQQFALQLQYVDSLVSAFLERLEDEGLLETSMVIVGSDHGLSFVADGDIRARETLDPVSLSHVMPVPLFVRYPEQSGGEVDERTAQLTDVLPTIADVLDVALPADWSFDGSSLLEPPVDDRPLYWHPVERMDADAVQLDPTDIAARAERLFGPAGGAHDLYAMGPHRQLVGREAAPVTNPAPGPGSLDPIAPEAYEAVALRSKRLPAAFEAEVRDLQEGEWVAVALNGVIAGVSPVLPGAEQPRLRTILDPDLFVEGANDVDAYVVEDAAVLRPLPLR